MFPIFFQAIICTSRRPERNLVTVLGLAAQIFQGSVLCACSITCLVSMSMLSWCICGLRQMAHSQELQMYLAMLEITGFGKRSNWAMANNHTKLLLKVSEMEINCNVDVKKLLLCLKWVKWKTGLERDCLLLCYVAIQIKSSYTSNDCFRLTE